MCSGRGGAVPERNRVPGFGCGNYSMGSDGLGFVSEVWTEPLLGTRCREPKV